MSYLAIFKRVVPFLLTFAAGLLIASVFIPMTSPNFSGFSRVSNKRHHYHQLKKEAEDLRRDNYRLKNENEQLRREARNLDTMTLEYKVPEVVLDPPVPPIAPKAPRNSR